MGSGFFDYPTTTSSVDDELDFLADASDTDWSMLLDYGRRLTLAEGERAVEAGSSSRSLMIVLSGSFHVTTPTRRRGRERVIGLVRQGSVIGELGFLDGRPRSHHVVAIEPAEVLELDWGAFERLAAVRPRLGIVLLTDVARVLALRFRILVDDQ